ncbi:Crp/Fnr family transcriptional regulator [Noviherbaspirillum saxi]|uniref:Crp/Fnr family transcriptional regulator n=1 Tax=Noviherbaspirillum saxi TaxID=2320863 RepID=A0A3A3FQI2_9BURK|nr:Crp/Fnr family transcriptional regulator [Noviherbaspirillum saxi]RJF98472.1 Crp/Fnr family transcriptional regulator [Noviherbaspirillum saxi]
MQNRSIDQIDKASVLRRSWLSGFSDDVIDVAAACGTLRSAEDGTLIHARGAEADGFYTIASGAVRFTRATADGQSTTIAVLDAPNCFGEISLFDGLPRTHDGHASGPTILLFHAKTDFKRLLARYPSIYERFAKVLSMRLRATFDLVEEAVVAPLTQRLARRLLELAHIKPSPLNAAVDARGREVPLTQEELGHLLGKSRQSISKQLHAWEQNGLIKTKYGRISIRQPEVLASLAYPEQTRKRTVKPLAPLPDTSSLKEVS